MNNIAHGNINLVENNSHTKITQNDNVLQGGLWPQPRACGELIYALHAAFLPLRPLVIKGGSNLHACGELSTRCRLPFIHGAPPLRPLRGTRSHPCGGNANM